MDETKKIYEVIISERATEMLLQHIRFVSQVSIQASEKLRIEIIEAAKSLRSFPERYSWLTDSLLPVNKYRKMIINKRYLLIYQIKGHIVYIEYVLDCRQDYKWLLL